MESPANKDAICKSNNKEKAIVRYTCSMSVGEIIAESEAKDIHSFDDILSLGCANMLGIKRIERAKKEV